MTVTAMAFYLFALTGVGSGLLVVVARNPVHSVLWLILSFFSAAGLFVLMGAEFVAMLLDRSSTWAPLRCCSCSW